MLSNIFLRGPLHTVAAEPLRHRAQPVKAEPVVHLCGRDGPIRVEKQFTHTPSCLHCFAPNAKAEVARRVVDRAGVLSAAKNGRRLG